MTKRPHSLRNAALQAVLLDGNRFGDVDHIAVNRLVHGQCNVDIVVNDLVAGNGNNSGMNGMPITKEFAFIAREVHSQNGGWL